MADVTLPQLGETVTEGTITRWFKQVGDSVAADEPLFEVSTDKVDTEVPSPVAGTLSEIRAQEGDTVDVGTVIAVVGDGAAPSEAPAEAAQEPQTEAEQAPQVDEQQAPQAKPEPAPQEGPADEAPEQQGEQQAETEPAPAVEPSPEDESAPATDTAEAAAEPSPPAAQQPAPAEPSGDGATARLLSPVVRRLVNEHGLDPATISGTGPGGRITRDDVLDHIDAVGSKPTAAPPSATEAAAPKDAEQAPPPEPEQAPPKGAEPPPEPEQRAPAAAPAAPEAPAPAARPAPAAAAAPPTVSAGDRDESVRLSKIRKLTGEHMVMSKGVSPHAFSVVEVDFANVDTARSAVKADWKQTEGFSLTYLPFICRAAIDAFGDFPHLNASVGDNQLVIHRFVDLGIAVDLDYEGLLVPVIRDADGKRLRAIAREIHDLADRARTRKLMPDEIAGGTFTISNNGSAGSVLTMPIINQPQVAILSTDAITRKPVVTSTADGGEAIGIHPVGNLAMSWDHRAFDGAYAAGYLRHVKEILEAKDWSGEL